MKEKAIMFTVLLVLFLVSVFHFGVSSGAGDSHSGSGSFGAKTLTDWWSMFHHDLSHTGFSPSTAPETNHTAWTSRPGGSFEWSSTAIVDDVVYVGTSDGRVYSLNATTGGIVESSPAVVDGIVYVGSYDCRVYALNASTGKQMWNYTADGDVISSPSVTYGEVFVGSWAGIYGNIYALNASTGAKIWNYRTDDAVYSSPAVANGMVFVGSMDGTLYAFGPGGVIPEFSSFLVLPSFMTVTLLAVLAIRRKHPPSSRE